MREYTAAERFAAAQLAREDLYFFSRWMFQQRKGYDWQRASHHKLITDALMRVFAGETTRLVINIPPRYSKTELAVVNFIAWALGKVPDAEFIHISYSAELAQNNASNILSLVQHEAYQEIFPGTKLASDAKKHWKTSANGVMYSQGTGGSITGFGAGKLREGFGGAIIVDDPHKADEADSDVVRQGVLDWFQNTLESRKNAPHTPMIVIMQRLHEDDLSGWLLDGGNGETWEHLCLPALDDEGNALWPEKHTAEKLAQMEAAAPYVFAGQYQQRPAPLAGGMIKPDKMPILEALPLQTHIEWVRGWDLASTDDIKKGAYTAGAKIGKLPDGRFVIADMVRMKAGPDDRDAAMLNTAKRDGYLCKVSIPQDPGQAGKTQVTYLVRQFAGFNVSATPESGEKAQRALPLAAQINVGNVLLLKGEWNDALIQEMRMFPNGKYKDQVDACSRAFSELIGGNELDVWAALASS